MAILTKTFLDFKVWFCLLMINHLVSLQTEIYSSVNKRCNLSFIEFSGSLFVLNFCLRKETSSRFTKETSIFTVKILLLKVGTFKTFVALYTRHTLRHFSALQLYNLRRSRFLKSEHKNATSLVELYKRHHCWYLLSSQVSFV